MPGSQNAHEYPGYSVITQFLADFWPAALVITDVGVCSMVTATLCSCGAAKESSLSAVEFCGPEFL